MEKIVHPFLLFGDSTIHYAPIIVHVPRAVENTAHGAYAFGCQHLLCPAWMDQYNLRKKLVWLSAVDTLQMSFIGHPN